MATQYQLRRGTTAEVLLFTGAQGEIIVNTDTHAVVVQDGVTAGGYPMATQPQISNGTFYYNEDFGSAADAYILVPKSTTNVPTGYIDGVQFGFVSVHPNTGPATANFHGLGVKSLKYAGGADPQAGDINGRVYLIYDATNGWLEIQRKVTAAPAQILPVSGSVASSNLTASLLPCAIDFRSPTLGSGATNTRTVTSTVSVTAPNGATLGTVSGVLSRIAILAIYGPVNAELALINLNGALTLDETTLISTTAISVASSSLNVAYSTTARANVPFRIVGFLDSTQVTAGAWNTSPSTVQGAGGEALNSIAALGNFGVGQVPTDVTASRAFATNYVNSTKKMIFVEVTATATSGNALNMVPTITPIGGSAIAFGASSSANSIVFASSRAFPVPAGATYSLSVAGSTGTITLSKWIETR